MCPSARSRGAARPRPSSTQSMPPGTPGPAPKQRSPSVPTATINGLSLAYEVVGDSGQPWVITPGGRFTKESPGVRQLAEALAAAGQQGAHLGPPQLRRVRRVLRGLVGVGHAGRRAGRPPDAPRHDAGHHCGGLGRRPGLLLTAARHPETAAGLAIWWISGGVYGLLSLATHYCGGSVQAAWTTAWKPWRTSPNGPRCRS